VLALLDMPFINRIGKALEASTATGSLLSAFALRWHCCCCRPGLHGGCTVPARCQQQQGPADPIGEAGTRRHNESASIKYPTHGDTLFFGGIFCGTFQCIKDKTLNPCGLQPYL